MNEVKNWEVKNREGLRMIELEGGRGERMGGGMEQKIVGCRSKWAIIRSLQICLMKGLPPARQTLGIDFLNILISITSNIKEDKKLREKRLSCSEKNVDNNF